jgi:hypothetical protein
MQVRIKETGIIENLSIVDPQSGVNWATDLVGNHGFEGFYSSEAEAYDGWETTQENYDWWEALLVSLERAENRKHALIAEHGSQAVHDALDRACDVDLEDMPSAITNALDEAFGA